MSYGLMRLSRIEKFVRLPNWLSLEFPTIKVGDICYRVDSGTVKWKNPKGVWLNLGVKKSYTKVVNSKIVDLAEQANATILDYSSTYDIFDYEKLVELAIKECLQVMKNTARIDSETESRVLKHFNI